jgi:DnaK suppressor protein
VALTATQRQHLEQRLQEERRRAQSDMNRLSGINADSTQERSGDLTKVPLHMADLGTDENEEQIDASNATRLSRELTSIDNALIRLYRDPEHFGICADTGEAIPFERLEIIPWANTCRDAGL